METKDFSFKIEESKSLVVNGQEFFTFKGYASTFGNTDRHSDVISKGAFVDSLNEMMPALLWQHDMKQPLGVYTVAREDEKGLYVEGQMPLDDDLVRGRVVPQMKAGSIKTMSVGFSTEVDEIDRNTNVRIIKRVKLYEISLVTIPANPKAIVTGMKSVTPFQDFPLADRDTEWDSTAAVNRVREFYDSSEAPSSDYSKAFFWYDNTAPELFGSYKLPYVDIVDGKPMAIFRAISAGAGRLNQTDIPGADKMKIENHMDRYYAKARQQYDDEGIVAPFKKALEEVSDLKGVEGFLKSKGLSQTDAKFAISKVKQIQRDAVLGLQRDVDYSDVVNGLKMLTNVILNKGN